MKTEFRFNSTRQLHLSPEGQEERQMLQLLFNGRTEVRLVASPGNNADVYVIETRPTASHEQVLNDTQ